MGVAKAVDAGHVQQDIQFAKLCDGRRNGFLAVVCLRQITGKVCKALTTRLVLQLLQLFRRAGNGQHLSAL